MKKSVLFTARHVIIALFAVACATAQTEGESKSSNEPKKDEPIKSEAKNDDTTQTRMVQGREQENVKSWMAKRPEATAEAFCVFSSGGWTNRGQHCVFTSGKTKILYSKSFQAKEYVEKKISDADLATFKSLNKTMIQLKSIRAEAFDHLKFEYVVFAKNGSEVTAGTRVLIDHPNPETVSKKYLDTIDAFLTKVEKLNPK